MKQKTEQKEEYELEVGEVRFRHLSMPLKAIVVVSWCMLVLYIIGLIELILMGEL